MKHYGTNSKGEPKLDYISCDEDGCDNILKPGPHVVESGWQRCGVIDKGEKFEWDYCHLHNKDWPEYSRE